MYYAYYDKSELHRPPLHLARKQLVLERLRGACPSCAKEGYARLGVCGMHRKGNRSTRALCAPATSYTLPIGSGTACHRSGGVQLAN
ncbi:hypothetical protein FIBSPDRAFT_851563 [Athelia psychrophila]|uniref:Uncharacterized protein n=1 Tax=Athelia psychrophila TaxID=1759441 RepID=A0A166S9V5_9AGAM|nr:hypothetical protein FIBSPDRAFT_851563 [Fibularhizoctonia sp. CBS 109695]